MLFVKINLLPSMVSDGKYSKALELMLSPKFFGAKHNF
jgi:hypothetical protein